jgi:hypothetical protein
MRISKSIAEKASRKMTVKHYEKVNSLRNLLGKEVSELYLKTIPSEVVKMFYNHPSYFKTTGALYVRGTGLNHELVSLDISVPSKVSHATTFVIESDEDSKVVARMADEYKQAKKDADNKMCEIEQILIALGSTKNVLEQFPEAIDFIDNAPQVRNLPVNLKELRKEFQSN